MNLIFLGTPEFAVPILRAINNSSHKILAVVSQPDREKDKKGRIIPTPIKSAAQELGLKVFQFEKISRDGIDTIKKLKPDVVITAAYGQMLSEEFLSIPKYGVLNVHGSILPAYRGSSPIHAAILNGDTQTGITIMKTVYKMDAGDIIKTASLPIYDTTTFIDLHYRMADLGAKLIVEVLNDLENGKVTFTPQDESRVTFTKKITKADGLIDWSNSAKSIIRKINAFNPWPTAYTFFGEDNLKIYSAILYDGEFSQKNGEIISANTKNGLVVKCGDKAIKILTIQAPGKKQLDTIEFLRGYELKDGDVFR